MIDALMSLSVDELRSVAAGLRAGRLPIPLSPLSLGPYVGRAGQDGALALVELTSEGLTGAHLAVFLDALASGRQIGRRSEADVELVSTGPEAGGVPGRDTRIVVRELFQHAERLVIVAGYAVYQGRDVFRALAERMDKNPSLAVKMFLDVQRAHADTTLASELLRRFADRFRRHEWPGSRRPEVFYDPRSLDLEGWKRASLHAKCIVVDDSISFISSANFTEAAQVRNVEIGVLIESESFARQLAGHFLGLADRRLLERVPGL